MAAAAPDDTTPVVQTEIERPTPAPSPTATLDPADPANAIGEADRAAIARAREWFDRVRSGTIDRAELTPAFADVLSPEIVRQTSALLTPDGPPKIFNPAGKFVRDGTTTYDFFVGWDGGGLVYQISFDDATGKIAGYFTRPPRLAADTMTS